MDETRIQRIPAPLLAWYEAHKRDLPWRENPTPYRVWVSEIMLQQTRVEAVKEYYLRFMRALPTVEDLASCEEEKLLKLWEGLGYYSRVRNMQKAARQLLIYHGGEFPSDKKTLQTLAGIGSYTAGAIASIAFGKRESAVDGNVLRVLSRVLEDGTPISDTAHRKEIEQTLSRAYPPRGICVRRLRKAFSSWARSFANRKTPIAGIARSHSFARRRKTARKRCIPYYRKRKKNGWNGCSSF